MKIHLRPAPKDGNGKPVVYQSQLPPEQQPKPRAKKSSPEREPTPPVEMSEEERLALEAEKRELVAQLQARVPRPASSATSAAMASEPALAPDEIAPVEEAPVPQAPDLSLTATAVADAVSERQRLEADIKALEGQLAAARLREKQAQQLALQAQQRATQQQGAAGLAPLKPKLERHLAEVSRIQSTWGPALRDYARSMATGADPQLRQAKADAYRSAAPLGQKLGDARATVEAALKGLAQAMESSHAHVHSQASTLAEAALSINLLGLETEVKSLVQHIHELNPQFSPGSVTPDIIPPPSWGAATSRPDTAFLGTSLI